MPQGLNLEEMLFYHGLIRFSRSIILHQTQSRTLMNIHTQQNTYIEVV